MHTTLIQPAELKALLQSGANLRVFDVSFDLMRPEQGNATYLETHLAGALHADINRVLSAKDPREAINGGRHPLPRRERFATWLSSQGVDDATQVVVYDRNGMNYCGRLWWMLKWCGHEAVAVLDGGLQAWVAEGGAVSSGSEPAPSPRHFSLRAPLARLVQTADVAAHLQDASAQTLIDARATPRFRGETEPLDPVAGHIPGALNRPYGHNLTETGKFKSGCAAPGVRTTAGRAHGGQRGASLWQWRFCRAQHLGDGNCRTRSSRLVCGQLERVVYDTGSAVRPGLNAEIQGVHCAHPAQS